MSKREDNTETIDARKASVKLPLSVVVSFLFAVGSVLFWNKLDAIENKITSVWTRSEMSDWTYDLQKNNPNLDVPVVRAAIADVAGSNRREPTRVGIKEK